MRVSDIAEACGVSTKTVWNHLPTKESLLFDRGKALAETLRRAGQERCDVVTLWRVHLGALLRCSETDMPPAEVRHTVLADVDAAAEVVNRVIDALAPH